MVNTQQFIKLWNEGVSGKEIAEQLGICNQYVYLLRMKLGLSKRANKNRAFCILTKEGQKEKFLLYLKEKGVCSQQDFLSYFHLSNLPKTLRDLVYNREVSTFVLHIGMRCGSNKFNSADLFDGIAIKKYYYIDKNEASKFIVEKLNLRPDLSLGIRKALTHHLKRCLNNDLFELVYKTYLHPSKLNSKEFVKNYNKEYYRKRKLEKEIIAVKQ